MTTATTIPIGTATQTAPMTAKITNSIKPIPIIEFSCVESSNRVHVADRLAISNQ